MKITDEYKVKLDLFEGPLDLLLYLVNKSEVAITDISIAAITKQYLDYLDIMRDLNINIASEYLSMAATLLRLKAREMLPTTNDEILEEDGIIDRQQLIDKLLEYKKFKEAAGSLKIYEAEQIGSYPRGKNEEVDIIDEKEEISFGSINMFDLITAFKTVLERSQNKKSESYRVIKREDVKIDDRIEYIFCMIEEKKEVLFDDLLKDDDRRIVLIVTFMAILELAKMKQITFRQEDQFGSIFLKKHPYSINKEE